MRWSPDGEILASSSIDKTASLRDFGTGKLLYTGEALDDGNLIIIECKSQLFDIR